MEPVPKKRKKKTDINMISGTPLSPIEPIAESKPIIPQNLLEEDHKKIQLVRELNNEQISSLINMEGFISEFLDDFIIIGHAIDGSRVAITHARSPKDFDSLEQFYTDNLIMMKAKKHQM